MANSQKVVDVPDIGVVAFPGDMEDTHVANYIKIARAKKKFSPLQTEESEHARQLKPAQPLDTAIPKLPDWATRPLLSEQEMQETPEAQRKTEQSQAAFTAEHPKIASAIGKGDNPAVLGVLGGAKDFMHGMTSPANLALMVGAPESKLLSAFFSMQALKGSYRNAQEAQDAYLKGNNTEAIKYATEALLGAGIAGLAGHHAVKDVPVPEGVKDFVKSEEGSVGPQGTVPPKEDNTLKILTDGKHGGYTLDYWLKNHPDVKILSVGKESIDPSTLRRLQGWTRESKLDEWKTSNANVKDMPPVEVVRTPHGDYLYDGTHRTEFATRQGEKVPATVYTIKNRNDATPAPNINDVKAKAAELKPTTAYKSVDQSQPFFLKSENLITEKMKGPMPAEDVHRMLLSNGVKPEEMKWTGLDELLQGKGKQKVTPQEIQEHLAGNNLQVQEVTKGAALGAKNPNELSVEEYGKPYDQLDAYQQRYIDTITEAHDKASPHATKFGSYVLPGAEKGSYRELLVTMPPKTVTQHFLAYKGGPTIGQGYANLTEAQSEMADLFPNRDDIEIRQGRGDRSTTTRTPDNFRSSHWDEPNVLGHVRFNDRVAPNGEKLLHIEELQSDWGQKIRKEGVKKSAAELAKLPMKATPYNGYWEVHTDDGQFVTNVQDWQHPEVKTAADAIKEARRRIIEDPHKTQIANKGQPPMPFSKTWPELLLKRMLKYAATNGYDGVSWTPGEEQASRYDLSKQVDKIAVPMINEDGSRSVRIDPAGRGHDSFKMMVSPDGTVDGNYAASQFSGKKLDEVIGKEMAKRVMEATKPIDFSGEGLKVGGEGMKGFYDKIIPDAANKLGKQWGAKVGDVDLGGKKYTIERSPDLMRYRVVDQNGRTQGGRGIFFSDKAEAEKAAAAMQAKEPPMKVPYLPITPQMRAGVKSIPFSLFSIPLAAGALSLAQVKAKAEELKKKSGVQ